MAKKAVAKKKTDQALKYSVIAFLISVLAIATIGAVRAYGPTGLVIQGSVNQNR